MSGTKNNVNVAFRVIAECMVDRLHSEQSALVWLVLNSFHRLPKMTNMIASPFDNLPTDG